MFSSFIDTPGALKAFLDDLPECKGQPPSLYFDLEGENLSRHGSLSLITIFVQPQGHTYLIDVTSLKDTTFSMRSDDDMTLKGILEHREIPKVFFDIRNNSAVLFWLFGIRVQGMEDLQLIEIASRNFNRRYVNGLAKCIERDLGLDRMGMRLWLDIREQGRKLLASELGGSSKVFDERPLLSQIQNYCIQGVIHMPRLREKYLNKLCDAWWLKIMDETSRRIQESQNDSFNGTGRHMALGPSQWADWIPSVHERHEQTLFKTESLRSAPMASSSSVVPPNQTGCHEDLRKRPDLSGLYCESTLSSPSVDSEGYRSDNCDDLTACDKECGYCGRCPY